MTTRRIKDTAGLLPDRVTVELDGHSDDFGAFAAVLTANTPRRRIEALRRHSALSEQADRLATRLDALGGTADHPLLTAIAQAEQAGLYQDAAPLAIRDAGRQRGTSDGGVNSGKTRRRDAEQSKQRAIERWRFLIATGDRDSDEAITIMVDEGLSRPTLYRYLKDELAKIGRGRRKPVKRK